MIEQPPRQGYGYGIIRMSWQLTEHLAPLAQISQADVQGHLHDTGVFNQLKSCLLLPDDTVLRGVFFEPPRRTWCVLVEAKDIPIAGEMLPVLKPVYQLDWDAVSETYQRSLVRIDVSDDHDLALRVD